MQKFSIFLLMLMVNIGISQVPEELGKVHWNRDYNSSLKLAERDGKPLLLLFQEIPGCSTCKKFGNDVMSNALLVELIETYFVPVAIYNNLKGADAIVLQKFGEPSWNNPVLRIVDAKGKDLLERHAGQYSIGSVINYVNKGIFQAGNLVPSYARLLEEEYSSQKSEMTLEMYCFWSGEKNIGKQDGVTYTEPGYSNGKEVVKVIFNPEKTTPGKIMELAKKSANADAVHTDDQKLIEIAKKQGIKSKPFSKYSIDKDVHYYLKNSIYASVPMSSMQATKVNSALGNQVNADIFLSPKQLIVLDKIKKGKMAEKSRYLNGVSELLSIQ